MRPLVELATFEDCRHARQHIENLAHLWIDRAIRADDFGSEPLFSCLDAVSNIRLREPWKTPGADRVTCYFVREDDELARAQLRVSEVYGNVRSTSPRLFVSVAPKKGVHILT